MKVQDREFKPHATGLWAVLERVSTRELFTAPVVGFAGGEHEQAEPVVLTRMGAAVLPRVTGCAFVAFYPTKLDAELVASSISNNREEV